MESHDVQSANASVTTDGATAPCVHVLPPEVANQIAAGEVVERPASVVKELVENAIDAEATRIDVEIERGGTKRVAVADNGCGMVREDAVTALQPHATSKIRSALDLGTLVTMGFRGEALPSIASVTRFTLTTRRREQDAGTRFEVLGGTVQDIAAAGSAPGTLVEARDLFFNLPPRRKFLASPMTEQGRVATVFRQLAIAHPEIAFSLKCDGRLVHSLAACASLDDRLRDICGEDFGQMVAVDFRDGEIRVSGYAGRPNFTRGDTSEQLFFVNRRVATAPVLFGALKDAYHDLPPDRRAIVYLFIDLPPEEVDVNVHPTKREVKFRAPSRVRAAVVQAVVDALYPANSFVSDPSAPAVVAPYDLPAETAAPSPRPVDLPRLQAAPPLVEQVPESATEAAQEAAPTGEAESAAPSMTIECPLWKRATLLGVLDSGLAVIDSGDGIVVFNPSEAHARVVYERLLEVDADKPVRTQRLLFAQQVTLPPADAVHVRSLLPALEQMGFEIDELDGDTFMVYGLPDSLQDEMPPLREMLVDLSASLETAKAGRRSNERWREDAIAKAAARAAVPRGHKLPPAEILRVLRDLSHCNQPYVGLTGTPTMLSISDNELKRRLGLRP